MPPEPLEYRNDLLFFSGISIQELAERFGTPLYVYSESSICRSIDLYRKGAGKRLHRICFAVKALSNISILRLMARESCGADIVSGGELFRAMKAGIEPSQIVFSGVGKSAGEIREALEADILLFSVESEEELGLISRIASERNKIARISLRMNPDVDANTHPYISTGLRENKFGIDRGSLLNIYKKILSMPGLDAAGIGFHIGSQLTGLSPFQDAASILSQTARLAREMGINLRYIDVGGGLGISYNGDPVPGPDEYARQVCKSLDFPDIEIIFEPGRSLVGNAGILISRVLFVKDTPEKKFYICDAAMNDLIRPSLYQAYHGIWPEKKSQNTVRADLVGPVCETGDFLAQDRMMGSFSSGDLLAVASAGAYGSVMSSNYNSRPRAAEVMVGSERAVLIRKREDYNDLIRGEEI